MAMSAGEIGCDASFKRVRENKRVEGGGNGVDNEMEGGW